MFKEKEEVSQIEIDLTGPEGNAFNIMGVATRLGEKLGKSKEDIRSIINEMTSGDYEHLLEVFDREFGEFVIMYR